MEYIQFIQYILKKATYIANANFGKVKGSVKPEDNNQVLTQTDLEIGKLIVNEISNFYPSFNIIDEEAGVIDKGSSILG